MFSIVYRGIMEAALVLPTELFPPLSTFFVGIVQPIDGRNVDKALLSKSKSKIKYIKKNMI